MQKQHIIIVLCLICGTAHARMGTFEKRTSVSKAIQLYPGVPLNFQEISLDDEVIRYLPVDLLPSRGYEVPAAIHLWLEAGTDVLRRQHRKLLNAEKIMFKTGPDGGIIVNGKERSVAYVMFQAKSWAQSRDGPDKGPKLLVYDIILEENVLGVPVSALPIVITAVGAVVLCVIVLPWWAGAGAPAIVKWLIGKKKASTRTRTRR